MNDLEAAAGQAVLTGQIRSFIAWAGAGRKLTQTGRIGLADARHLVELLGTGDKTDPKTGDRVGTRLVPVKKNASLPGSARCC
jgi:hypothetical protein